MKYENKQSLYASSSDLFQNFQIATYQLQQLEWVRDSEQRVVWEISEK